MKLRYHKDTKGVFAIAFSDTEIRPDGMHTYLLPVGVERILIYEVDGM